MPNDTLSAAGRPLEADETDRLISSEKVDGTAVYDRTGGRLGTVHHLMIDKYNGHVEYVIWRFSRHWRRLHAAALAFLDL